MNQRLPYFQKKSDGVFFQKISNGYIVDNGNIFIFYGRGFKKLLGEFLNDSRGKKEKTLNLYAYF